MVLRSMRDLLLSKTLRGQALLEFLVPRFIQIRFLGRVKVGLALLHVVAAA